jgi:hypothetical protein
LNEAYIPPITRLATHFSRCWGSIDSQKKICPAFFVRWNIPRIKTESYQV